MEPDIGVESTPLAPVNSRVRIRDLAPSVVPILALILAVNLYAVWFVGEERTLYHADHVAYWSYSSNLAEMTVESPFTAVRAVAWSVANHELNLLPAAPVAAAMALFGDARLSYVLAVITIYGLAAALALLLGVWRLDGRPRSWVVSVTFLLFPTMWRAVFLGYLGIGGVAIALVVVALAWGARGATASYRLLSVAGAALALLVVFRRWWLVWATAFLIVVAVDGLKRFLVSRCDIQRRLKESLLDPLVFAASAIATVLVLSAPVMVRRLTTDYADRFTIWRLDSVGERWAALVGHFGVVGLLLVAAAVLVLVRTAEMRRPAILLALHAITTYAIMTRIQDHSPQHWYLYYPQILLLVALAAGRVVASLPRNRQSLAAASLVTLGVIVTAAVFVPAAARWTVRIRPLLPTDRIEPTIRDDVTEVRRMLVYLDGLLQRHPGGVYVLASAPYLSDQVLAFANLSLGADYRSPRAVIHGSHADRRDGFPRGLLVAAFVLVPDPLVLVGRPEDQRVIVEPALSFHQGTDVALAFRRLPQSFHFDDGIRVLVFERLRNHTREEVAALGERLRTAYPDRPEIYLP